jgi:hypothetical protein
MNEHIHDFKSAMVLQNCVCVGVVKDEPDSKSEACVTTFDDRSEEGNMEVEESLDTKEEKPEAIIFATIKPEPEVSVWVCV